MASLLSGALLNLSFSDAAQVFTVVGVLGALLGLAWQIRKSRQDVELAMLQRLIDAYEQLSQHRWTQWATVKKAIKSAPDLSHTMDDKTNSIDYLLRRLEQTPSQPLAVIEHGIIEDEIRSVNLLNEICRLSGRKEYRKNLVRVLLSSEIAFYQWKLAELRHLRSSENAVRRFSVLRIDVLQDFEVGDFFEPFIKDD